jgi:hypothetical protein
MARISGLSRLRVHGRILIRTARFPSTERTGRSRRRRVGTISQPEEYHAAFPREVLLFGNLPADGVAHTLHHSLGELKSEASLAKEATKMATHLRLALIFVLLVATVGCGKSSSPASPSPPSLTGTWVGPGFFTGTLTFQLAQSGTSLTGPWTSTQTNPPPLGGGETIPGPSGTLTGSANGSSVSITFAEKSGPTCPFPIVVSAAVNGNQMTGSYATQNSSCSPSFTFSGSGTWTRQ